MSKLNADSSPPQNTVGMNVPLDWTSVEAGYIPIFWGDNQIGDGYPSGMGKDQTLHVPKVCRFIYTFGPHDQIDTGLCNGHFQYGNIDFGDGFFKVFMISINIDGEVLQNVDVVFANTSAFFQSGAINIIWGTSSPHPVDADNAGTGQLGPPLQLNDKSYNYGS